MKTFYVGFLCLLYGGGGLLAKKKFVKSKLPVTEKPHIVFILADDLGWNEVSWHNPGFHTPRMDELSREGVRLEESYVAPKCSPSRAALLTGIYPWRMGRQRGAIERFQATGLNTSLPLMPELLAEGGYTTSMVGKWHLGYCNSAFLPTNRGFHSFFGQFNHVTDYYTRAVEYNNTAGELKSAHDLHEGTKPSFDGHGEFSTDLYTRKAVEVIEGHPAEKPLFLYLAYQAPHMNIQEPPAVYLDEYTGKRVYQEGLEEDDQALYRAAAVTALDTGVGKVVDALKAAGLYNNSIIIFSTDNGGVKTSSSNFPLRGAKESVLEGGVRGVGWVHSPHVNVPGSVMNQKIYITDWLATLLTVAGLGSLLPPDTDSLNMWPSVSWGRESPREEIVLNLDQDTYWNTWSAAIIMGKYKLIWGQRLLLKQHLEEESCNMELYNLKRDPEETINLLIQNPKRKLVAPMRTRLMEHFRRMAPADYPDPRWVIGPNDPANFGGVLSPGWCKNRV